jgi:hypothetical protein
MWIYVDSSGSKHIKLTDYFKKDTKTNVPEKPWIYWPSVSSLLNKYLLHTTDKLPII